ncbi:uncharacterized protein Z519_11919 [Cladophialophora bantiana CBS 173.52]|uniref:Xylulose 5-phosphate/Fructose 6-phosphate phosphoketolase C-terminal domain-containing protein n=1 Tax=Cladophialophora bantiana (strain ATCC 10958 / CBS 173.52 / CDC B-1940 / NIH 8579) TaxID=1442370 RepID=A0A0D2HT39_CLAB1|nr:uncharacterized protein Z519_11919 [Cladophialophora bantiana CBS 173.52]KIW87594.1 hypothetical protein Z519_11919 [Cladophialophora bantiana CBS 173.52]
MPGLRVWVVNVTDLMILEASSSHPQALTDDAFDALFTEDVPIHFNYHGYANELKGPRIGRNNMHRVTIANHNEEGSTTTPFNMMLVHSTSRYHVAMQATKGAAKRNEAARLRSHEVTSELMGMISKMQNDIMKEETDPDYLNEIGNFKPDTASMSVG